MLSASGQPVPSLSVRRTFLSLASVHTRLTRCSVQRSTLRLNKVAGGSSGGAAVALATLLPVADGSDFMGHFATRQVGATLSVSAELRSGAIAYGGDSYQHFAQPMAYGASSDRRCDVAALLGMLGFRRLCQNT